MTPVQDLHEGNFKFQRMTRRFYTQGAGRILPYENGSQRVRQEAFSVDTALGISFTGIWVSCKHLKVDPLCWTKSQRSWSYATLIVSQSLEGIPKYCIV